MSDDPELPGGEVLDTGRARVEIGETQSEPLPGGVITQAPDPKTEERTGLLFQELVRSGLAIALVLLLMLVIVLSFAKVGTDGWADTKSFLEIIVPALIALLGSAMGFYFGSRR